jgi:hypothetical protein
VLKIDTNPPLAVVNATNDITDLSVDDDLGVEGHLDPGRRRQHARPPAGASRTASRSRRGTRTTSWFTNSTAGENEVTTNIITAANGPLNLATNATTALVISNLNFDSFYRIKIAGRDRAGNIGPFMTVTGLTVNFQVTQGLARTVGTVTNGIRLAWIAGSNRVYDMLYVDATTMSDA